MFGTRLRGKFVGTALLALLMLTLVPISISFAENQEEKRARKFVEIAEKAEAKVSELVDYMEENDIDIPQDLGDLYDKAVKDLQQAETVAQAKDAMQTFRKLFGQLHALLSEGELDTESGEKAQGILVAIDRSHERIERIKDANDTYFDYFEDDEWNEIIGGWIRENLTAAEENLAEATAALDVPNVEWASTNLTEANQNISDAFAALKILAEWTSGWRIESFVMGVKNSVDRTLELLERGGVDLNHTVSELGYQDLDDFLEDIEGNLTATRGFRRAGGKEIKQAIERIKTVKQMLMKVRKASHSKGGGHGKKP